MQSVSRLGSRFGIGSRLALAFCAVAVLAVAANLIAEHGRAIVYRTLVRNVPAARVPVGAVAPSVPLPVSVEKLRLASAVQSFGSASRIRAADGSDSDRAEMERAALSLDRETAAFTAAAGQAFEPAGLAAVSAALRSYRGIAEDLVARSEERRELVLRYRSTFDALDAHVKGAIDRAWKIFGRVVARESLVDLSRRLDLMRAGLPTPGAQSIPALAVEGEAAIAAAIRADGKSLSRSQGANWLAAARADVDALAEVRGEIGRVASLEADTLARFQRDRARIHELLRSLAPRVVASATSDDRGLPHGPAARRHPAVRSIETVSRASDDSVRTAIGWLSGGVLMLMLVISAATVVSIVRPVRRLMSATRRIAAGEGGVRVPRGGIRELDALGVSFNEMAGRLEEARTVAREYHAQLESKVEERTRQLQHLAAHDPLTQLPNRRELFRQLRGTLERAAAENSRVGVFFIDLDNFKNINDGMGHVFGDCVLQTFSRRLQAACSSSSWPARLGGDEFTVVVEGATGIEEIVAAGKALVRVFRDDPLVIDGREIAVSVSMGASVFPDHDTDAEALLRAADAALFRAKALGRCQLSVYSADLLEAAESRFTTEQGLRRAIERQEFRLFFQPEVNTESGRVDLVEALLRWQLPNGQVLAPQDFLSVAEECGLLGQIGKWVVRTAIETAAHWNRSGWTDVRVAINVSARQLLDDHFVEAAQELVRAADIPARCIEFELTENVLQTSPSTVETLRRLRAAGFGVALDDFGTGYSSLVSLEQLPLTRVKLDRSVIAGIDSNRRSLAIARAVIGLCEGLGLQITAEGIERHEQLPPLLGASGLCVQGFLISRPLPAADVLAARADIPAAWRALRGSFGAAKRLTSVA